MIPMLGYLCRSPIPSLPVSALLHGHFKRENLDLY